MIAKDFYVLLLGVLIGCPIGLALSVIMSLNAVEQAEKPQTSQGTT